MKKAINELKLRLPAKSENEAVARALVCSFAATLDPTVGELADLRCAVSEAVTNVVVHAYRELKDSAAGRIYISVRLYDTREITVEITDTGCGIADVEKAREPFFTTGKEDERCGMGFLVMESYTDSLTVRSKPGRGTTVIMKKKLTP
ncbi:MAG: anti-sigma F factor [Clostridia bacterium]|nr:anti-sigma F factor [Clostridia bacterium]